jgi:hypothetical protein
VADSVVTQVLNPTALTVPAGVSYVRVDATAGLVPSGNTGVAMWVQRGAGVCVDSGGDYESRQFGHTANQDSITVTRLISVTPGDHIFRMCVVAGADITVDNRNMVVQTVALAG